jgi:hypothetical protein
MYQLALDRGIEIPAGIIQEIKNKYHTEKQTM